MCKKQYQLKFNLPIKSLSKTIDSSDYAILTSSINFADCLRALVKPK